MTETATHPSAAFAAALAALQADLPEVKKTKRVIGERMRYTYADLADITAVLMPRLGALGLSFTARPTLNDAGHFVLAYKLLHTSGHCLAGEYPLPSPGASAQAIGSAITYARRYALCAVTGLAAEDDDDGHAAEGEQRQRQRSRGRRNGDRGDAPPPPEAPPEWDSAEQELLLEAWRAEIGQAKTVEEIRTIGQQVHTGRRSGELSPATVDKLTKIAAERRFELDGGQA